MDFNLRHILHITLTLYMELIKLEHHMVPYCQNLVQSQIELCQVEMK